MKLVAARLGFLALLVLLAVFCARRLDFGTDITNFMPDGRSAELAALARHLARSDLARTMFLTVAPASGERDDERVARAVTALKERLAGNPEVEWIRSGPQDTDLEQVWKLYFPHRFALVSLEPEREIPALLEPATLEAAARRAREALASPAAALVKRSLPADPLGFSTRLLDRMRAESPALEIRHGTFFSPDGWGVLMLATKSSAFDARRQAPLLADIDASFEAILEREGADLVLEKSGANRFSVDAERSMMRDMGWIAVTSILGIATLVFVYFRSAMRFALAMMPSVAGILAATALGLVVFGHLDGLTLAFGTSLIGVTVDYPVHLLNHQSMLAGSRRDVVLRLAPSLAMGALTTVASFVGLSMTSFPGFREIGFFAAVGVAAALAVTLFVLPWFLGDATRRPPRAAWATAAVLGRGVDWALGHRRALAAVPILTAAIGAVMLPRLSWQDDLSSLGNVNPALQQEETRVRGRVAPYEAGRVVLVMAGNEQDALERSEDVCRRMEKLRTQGAIGGYRSATGIVWSARLQERNLAALRSVPDLVARVDTAFEAAGFRAGSFGPFARDLAAAPVAPLTPADFDGTALARMLEPMLLDIDGRTAVLTQVSDPRDEPALRREIASVPGARYFVQRDFVNDLYAQFRDTTLAQLFVGGALVIAILALRYRRWRPALAAFLPSVLVCVLVLSGLALAGEAVNLLHVVSLIMVAGMGVDYGIFLVDSLADRTHVETTLVSLLLCCLTTVCGFAVIAVSEHPALRALGITIGSGVTLSLLMAPVSLLVMGQGASRILEER